MKVSKNQNLVVLPPISAVTYQRALLFFGHAFFITYILGTYVFYQERLFNFDSAYYTFHLIITDGFFVKHGRWISYLTQWIPLSVMEFGGSLKAFTQSYSMSFAIWFYVLYILIAHGFRNITGGLFYALAMGLAIRYKFYAAISEITFSLALAAVLIGWLTSRYRPENGTAPTWFWGIAALISLFLFGTHPIIIFPLWIFFVFDVVYHRRWRDYGFFTFIGVLTILYAWEFVSLSKNEYEQKRMGMVTHLIKVLESPNEFAVYHIIRKYFETEYTFPFVIVTLLLVILVYRRRFWSAIILLGGNIAWLFVNIGTYAYLRNHMYIMIDGYLALFGLIWAIPILFILLRSNWRWASLIIVGCLLVFSAVRIYEKHNFYTHRLCLLKQTLDWHTTSTERKFRIEIDQFDWDRMWYPYGVPHETLLLSSINSPDSTAAIYVNYESFQSDYFDSHEHQGFLQYDLNYPVNYLPHKYFNLPKGKYKLISKVAWID